MIHVGRIILTNGRLSAVGIVGNLHPGSRIRPQSQSRKRGDSRCALKTSLMNLRRLEVVRVTSQAKDSHAEQ